MDYPSYSAYMGDSLSHLDDLLLLCDSSSHIKIELRRLGREKEQIDFNKWVDKGWIATMKDLESLRSSVRSDKGQEAPAKE